LANKNNVRPLLLYSLMKKSKRKTETDALKTSRKKEEGDAKNKTLSLDTAHLLHTI